MKNLFTLSDDEILQAARDIIAERTEQAAMFKAAEIQRLYRQYASKLGSPKALTPEEALLLVAFERNRYELTVERSGSGRWQGDALCRYNVRAGAMAMRAESRHDLLLSLWASVSDQEDTDSVALTEEHLQGSLVRVHIRQLWSEVQRQESEPDAFLDDEEGLVLT